MMRVENIFDSRKLLKDFGASLQFEKGIEKTVMWYLFSKTYPQWSLHPLRFPRFRGTETSGKKRETALLGARNRYALRLAGHKALAMVVRDGTAGMLLGIRLLLLFLTLLLSVQVLLQLVLLPLLPHFLLLSIGCRRN